MHPNRPFVFMSCCSGIFLDPHRNINYSCICTLHNTWSSLTRTKHNLSATDYSCTAARLILQTVCNFSSGLLCSLDTELAVCVVDQGIPFFCYHSVGGTATRLKPSERRCVACGISASVGVGFIFRGRGSWASQVYGRPLGWGSLGVLKNHLL